MLQQKNRKGKDGKVSHETLKKQQYVSEWKKDIVSSSKLNSYGEIKKSTHLKIT